MIRHRCSVRLPATSHHQTRPRRERWCAPVGGASGGGTVSTAGNLVIQVVPDGRLIAYTAEKGEKVLEIQTGLRGGMGPPITYMLDGKQYVALTGGQGSRGRGESQVTPKLLVFTLDGRAPLQVTTPAR